MPVSSIAGSLSNVELDGLRADQTAQLEDTCLIWRVLSPGTLSKTDAAYSSPQTTTIYDGLCYFVPIVSRRDRFDIHGEQQIYQHQNRVLVPWDTFGIKIGDLIRVTVSADQDLTLKDMLIKDVLLVSDLTLRRLTCIDIDE